MLRLDCADLFGEKEVCLPSTFQPGARITRLRQAFALPFAEDGPYANLLIEDDALRLLQLHSEFAIFGCTERDRERQTLQTHTDGKKGKGEREKKKTNKQTKDNTKNSKTNATPITSQSRRTLRWGPGPRVYVRAAAKPASQRYTVRMSVNGRPVRSRPERDSLSPKRDKPRRGCMCLFEGCGKV